MIKKFQTAVFRCTDSEVRDRVQQQAPRARPDTTTHRKADGRAVHDAAEWRDEREPSRRRTLEMADRGADASSAVARPTMP
jgi:hypothetical protein